MIPIQDVCRRLVTFSVRHSRAVLAAYLLAVLLSSLLAAQRLELHTSNLDLIDPDLPPVARFREAARRLGTPNMLIVVLEGDAARLAAAADQLGPRLQQLPGVRGVLWRLPSLANPDGQQGLGYLRSRDGGLVFLFVQPDDPDSAATTLAPFVEAVRAELELRARDWPSVSAGVTGMPAYAIDDRDVIQHDISRLSIFALLAVLLLFAGSFGALRRPLLALVALLLGVGLMPGLISLYPGHLTLLSAFFASILFGLGVDAGIHLLAAVEEHTALGLSEAVALPRAAAVVGRSLITSTATTACVLFGLQLSGFRGFAELGVIAGTGMVLCLLAMLTALPALLVLWPTSGRERVLHERRSGRFLWQLQQPRWHRPLAALLILLAAFGGLTGGAGFDTDYLNLQPRGSETVRLEREMVRRSEWAPVFALFLPEEREQAVELQRQLRDEPTVAAVHSWLEVEDLLGPLAARLLPPELAQALRPQGGGWAIYAYPQDDVWQPRAQAEFVSRMQALDPEVTGMPILGHFLVQRSLRALRIGGALGLALLAVCVWLDFRRPWPALLAMLPALATVPVLLGLMRLLQLPFNPLNVMALPLILGIAVDDGVHLVHRFLHERGDLRAALAGSGHSILLTSLTTLAAFGSLTITSHRGLASFALALSLGVVAAFALTVSWLPWLLRRWPPAS